MRVFYIQSCNSLNSVSENKVFECLFGKINELIPVIYDFNIIHLFLARLTLLYIVRTKKEYNVNYDFTEDVRTFLISYLIQTIYKSFSGLSTILISIDFCIRVSWKENAPFFLYFLQTKLTIIFLIW